MMCLFVISNAIVLAKVYHMAKDIKNIAKDVSAYEKNGYKLADKEDVICINKGGGLW